MPHPLKKNILIVGGGFSGLTLAALLQKKEIFNIVVFEKDHTGGLIQAEQVENTLIEHAAPSLINHHELESFIKSYGLGLEPALKSAKRRYLFYDRLSRWPMGIFETVFFAWAALRFLLRADKTETLKGHSIESWAQLYLSRSFADKILRPALYGIYASDISELSASLTLNRFFDKAANKNRSKLKGSVIPTGGISHFLKLLKADLVKNQVQFIKKNLAFDELIRLKDDYIVIFATSFADFNSLIRKNPGLLLELPDPSAVARWQTAAAQVTTVSLIKAHLFFADLKNRINGFGVLFHPKNRFNSLGVIANSHFFAAYGPAYNEAWIIKGEDEEKALAAIREDRLRLLGFDDNIRIAFVKKHQNVYPVYNKALQEWQQLTRFQQGFYGTGNYWGALGLTQIFLYNKKLAEQITNDTQQE